MGGRWLLYPSYKGLTQSLKKRSPKLIGALAISGVLLILGLYYGLFRFLAYVVRAPMLGAIIGPMIGGLLVVKLLEMLYMALFFMVIFSSIIASFSAFYLDEELQLLFSSPLSSARKIGRAHV